MGRGVRPGAYVAIAGAAFMLWVLSGVYVVQPNEEAVVTTFGAYSPTTCDGTQLQIRNQKDISGEIRLASNGDSALNWHLGVYGLHIDRSVGVSLGADLGQGVSRELYNAPGSSNPTSNEEAVRRTRVQRLGRSAERIWCHQLYLASWKYFRCFNQCYTSS